MLNEDELREAALLVFANKQDQPGAKGAGDISEALRLGELRDRNWSIVACSAVDGKGVDEGMDWLVVRRSWPYLIQGGLLLIAAMAANGQLRILANLICIAMHTWHRRRKSFFVESSLSISWKPSYTHTRRAKLQEST